MFFKAFICQKFRGATLPKLDYGHASFRIVIASSSFESRGSDVT